MSGRIGAHRDSSEPRAPTSSTYLATIVAELAFAAYVVRIGRPGGTLKALLGTGWTTARRASVDLATAAAGWFLIRGAELGWINIFATPVSAHVALTLPHTPSECAEWSLLSLTAGISEELVFRGYLQTQLAAFTRRPTAGLVLQAALFGIVHGELGVHAMVRIGLYGLGFGATARWRGSLLPGMWCHVATNVASGLSSG